MTQHGFMASAEAVQALIGVVQRNGVFEIKTPWPKGDPPKIGDTIALHGVGSNIALFAWIRVCAPGGEDSITKGRTLRIIAGLRPVPFASLPPPRLVAG